MAFMDMDRAVKILFITNGFDKILCGGSFVILQYKADVVHRDDETLFSSDMDTLLFARPSQESPYDFVGRFVYETVTSLHHPTGGNPVSYSICIDTTSGPLPSRHVCDVVDEESYVEAVLRHANIQSLIPLGGGMYKGTIVEEHET